MLEDGLRARCGIWWFCRRRNIQEGKPPLAAQGQQVVGVDPSQEVFEPCGSGLATTRGKTERRASHGNPVTGSLDPAAKGSFAEGLVAIPGGHGLLQGVLDTPADGL
jgi:hypothetical protein